MKIYAKYPGRCRACKVRFMPGERIEWERSEGTECWQCFVTRVAEWWDNLTLQQRWAALSASPMQQDTEEIRRLIQDTFAENPDRERVVDAYRLFGGSTEFLSIDIAQLAENDMVTDELLKGLAAAVEIATETGDTEALQNARKRALLELGVMPDLRVGMSYEDALSTLVATAKDILECQQASTATTTVADGFEPSGMPIGEDEFEEETEKPSEDVATAGSLPEQEVPRDIEKGAIVSEPLDLDKEDDRWLEQW